MICGKCISEWKQLKAPSRCWPHGLLSAAVVAVLFWFESSSPSKAAVSRKYSSQWNGLKWYDSMTPDTNELQPRRCKPTLERNQNAVVCVPRCVPRCVCPTVPVTNR